VNHHHDVATLFHLNKQGEVLFVKHSKIWGQQIQYRALLVEFEALTGTFRSDARHARIFTVLDIKNNQ
jgi:hypothetical protein